MTLTEDRAAALPVLETERLILRPRVPGDLEDCYAMDCEPGTTRWIEGPWHDPDLHRAFIRSRMGHAYPPGLGYWVITEKARPEVFLGWVLLIPDDAVGPEIEIGWRLRTATRGFGFAPEAAARLMAHGFETLGLDHVIAVIHRENLASRRVAEKIGMTVRHARIDGAPEHMLYEALPPIP